MKTSFPKWCAKMVVTVLAGSAVLGLTSCRTTHQVRSIQKPSGFLLDYSDLREGTDNEAKLVYINPNVDWKKYDKVIIDPVQLWDSDEPDSPLGKLPKETQQMLVDYLYTSLKDKLSENYQIVTQPGPDVMELRAAITEARPSKPVLDLLSSVTPIGLGISYSKRIIFGTGTSVGLVQVEAEVLDTQTHARLAAAVDRRAGTKALRTKFSGKWVDIKDAFDYWARRLQMRLIQLRLAES